MILQPIFYYVWQKKLSSYKTLLTLRSLYNWVRDLIVVPTRFFTCSRISYIDRFWIFSDRSLVSRLTSFHLMMLFINLEITFFKKGCRKSAVQIPRKIYPKHLQKLKNSLFSIHDVCLPFLFEKIKEWKIYKEGTKLCHKNEKNQYEFLKIFSNIF